MVVNNIKNYIPKVVVKTHFLISLVALINFLFSYKYFVRLTHYALPIAIIYSTALIFIYFVLQRQEIKLFRINFLFWSVVLIYAVFQLILFRYIKVEQLNVDRWSIISGFWENALHGKYPYSAQSHMGNYPGPMPVYFLLSLPFYLVHEVGYFSLLGFIGFAWFIRKYIAPKESAIALILLMASVPLFWEISVRSTILINAVLFLFYLHWLLNSDIRNTKYFYITAIVGGLLLSTRTIFAFALIVYGIFALKNKVLTFKQLFGWATVLSVTFIATFLPFLIFYFTEFLSINPFVVQSEFLFPFWYVPILLVIAGIAGIFCKQKSAVVFWVGAVFFLVFVIYAVRLCIIHGSSNAYLNSKIDLSYSLFSLPFMLYALGNKVDKQGFNYSPELS